jgi:hypothetical protein
MVILFVAMDFALRWITCSNGCGLRYGLPAKWKTSGENLKTW